MRAKFLVFNLYFSNITCMPPAISPSVHIALSRRYGCDKILDYHSKTLGDHGVFLITIAITKRHLRL